MKLIIIIFCLFLNLHFCFADDSFNNSRLNKEDIIKVKELIKGMIEIDFHNYDNCFKTKKGLLKTFPMLENMKCVKAYTMFDPRADEEEWDVWHAQPQEVFDNNCNACVQSIQFEEDTYYIIYGFSVNYACNAKENFFKDDPFMENKFIEIYSLKHNKVIYEDRICNKVFISHDKLVLPFYFPLYEHIFSDGTVKLLKYEK